MVHTRDEYVNQTINPVILDAKSERLNKNTKRAVTLERNDLNIRKLTTMKKFPRKLRPEETVRTTRKVSNWSSVNKDADRGDDIFQI